MNFMKGNEIEIDGIKGEKKDEMTKKLFDNCR
jgi:hypothetical protein